MIEKDALSYKDPEGFIFKYENVYFRCIGTSYATCYEHLMHAGLYAELLSKHLIIPHSEENNLPISKEGCYKILRPEQIDFITYPYEWSYAQWREVMLNYISINQIALRYGMILKDATPYNFTFHKGHLVLIDTSSFSFYKDNTPWIAYRQFCEEMLAPFALMHYRGTMWGRLYRAAITGMPLSFVSKQLPWKTKLNATCLLHIHLHAKFEMVPPNNKAKESQSTMTNAKLHQLFQLFKYRITKWKYPKFEKSIWKNYYAQDIENVGYIEDKKQIIAKWLSEIKPNTTVDLGSNTGAFSFLAAKYSGQVLSAEFDSACVDAIFHNSKKNKQSNVVPFVSDIVQPSPGLGWANAEKIPLLERLRGDVVMALALIHHLCIARNIPLSFVASNLFTLTTAYVIVEFVPKADTKVKLLLSQRKDIFPNYTEEEFIKCFGKYFQLISTHSCANTTRKLFLWEKY